MTAYFPIDLPRLEPGREEIRPARPKRGYVAKGECRDSRSCYLMGCESEGCLRHHTRYTKQNRALKLRLGIVKHGPVGYDCGCRCDECNPSRVLRYLAESLKQATCRWCAEFITRENGKWANTCLISPNGRHAAEKPNEEAS